MLPRFHAAQHLMLALGGKTIKALQPLFVLALRLARQSAERRVCFKRFPLLIKRALPLLVKPLSGVMSFRRRLVLRI